MVKPLNTEELMERLQRRVCGVEGQGHRAFLFTEVCIGERRADALSVGLWNSRGHKIEAYEAKSNRADWEREMEDHGKAEPAMEIADHFWLVTNPGIVQEHELPEKWGLLLSAGRRRHLQVAKPAPLLREGAPPVSRNLLAILIRSAQDLRYQRIEEIRQEERAQKRAGSDHDFETLERRCKEAEDRLEEQTQAFEAFREEAGFDLFGWRPRKEDMELIGTVAKALKGGPQQLGFLARHLKHSEEQAKSIQQLVREARQVIEEAT